MKARAAKKRTAIKQTVQRRKAIEKNLAEALPHAKFISANGCGELFASPSILNQLANWRPLAPKEECSVYLETNGSLFNEENWKNSREE